MPPSGEVNSPLLSYNQLYIMDVKSKNRVKVYRHNASIYPSDWGRMVFDNH